MKEHQELIEKYIQNRLSKEEEIVFDSLLKDDIAFRKEVQLHTNIKRAVAHEDDTNFRSLIAELESVRSIKKRSYTRWLVAASIALLVGLTYFFNIDTNATSNELFENYFEPYRNVIQPVERGVNSQQDEKIVAFTAYEKGDYQKAISLFTKLYMKHKESYYLFYKANALLKLEKASEAIPVLLEHLKTKDTLTEKSHWYLALAYLKLNNKSKAKQALKEVINIGTYKTKEATELLKKFD